MQHDLIPVASRARVEIVRQRRLGQQPERVGVPGGAIAMFTWRVSPALNPLTCTTAVPRPGMSAVNE
jgi:hypothetical protein